MDISNRILGAWYGQAYGDSMGMPGELWPISTLREKLGHIKTLQAGHPENIAANEFVAGEYTDDTSCAIAVASSLIENGGNISPEKIGQKILEWANSINAFERNILGPSTKSSLTAIKNGESIESLENMGVTNGCVMRILPVACAYKTDNIDQFIKNVEMSCMPTHKADVAVAGATAVAWAISCAIDGKGWDYIKANICDITEKAQNYGTSSYSPSVARRIKYALSFANSIKSRENLDYHKEFFDEIGTGMSIIETVPTALAIVDFVDTNPIDCAIFCANIGGDTDTIGAIATAICGAIHGTSAFNIDEIKLIEEVNNINFSDIANSLHNIRK